MRLTHDNKHSLVKKFFKNKTMDTLGWRSQFPDGLTKVVANIPARRNSTRVRNKNIRNVAGLPLLAYTIRTALNTPGIDRVVVNTDSREYAKLAERYGAEAPFIRPDELAHSKTSLAWAQYYLFRHLMDQDYPVKSIVTMLPTSPLRNVQHMGSLVRRLAEYGDVQVAMRPQLSLDHLLLNSPGGPVRLKVVNSDCNLFYKTLGNFSGQHIFNDEKRCSHIAFIRNPMELLDVDREEDLKLVEYVIENGLYDFGVN